MDFKTLYKPMSRIEEKALARYMVRTGITHIVTGIITDAWAGDRKNPSRGIASAFFITGITALLWIGVYGMKQEQRKEAARK